MPLSTLQGCSALQRFLNRLNSRSVLTAGEQQAILDLPGRAEQIKPNHDFVQLGEPVDHACLVVAGYAGRFGQTSQGKRQITGIYLRGDMADLHSVVQPSPTSALQALSHVTILRIPHIALRAVAARYPAVAEAFWRDCMVDAAIFSQWVINVGRRQAKQRIGHLICELALRIAEGEPSDGMRFDLPVTQAQLAEVTGLTPVHVNRTLMKLRGEGVLEWSRSNVVTIADWQTLVGTGDFDPAYLQIGIPTAKRMRLAEAN